MKYLQFTVVVFIALACFVELGSSKISCYQCNSFMENKCEDDFIKADNSDLLKECPGNATMCRKMKQEVYYDKKWNERTIRDCAYAGVAEKDCSDRTGTYRIKIKYCQCTGEGCNGGTNIKISCVAVLLPLFIAFAAMFKKL